MAFRAITVSQVIPALVKEMVDSSDAVLIWSTRGVKQPRVRTPDKIRDRPTYGSDVVAKRTIPKTIQQGFRVELGPETGNDHMAPPSLGHP
jgi:hypothetical protein